jgi:hypothetical protein
MSNCLTQIDKIGESNIDQEQETDLEHDLICALDVDIATTKKNVDELKDVIDGLSTYTDNEYIVKKLTVLHHRIHNGINAIEESYNEYKSLQE